ncbi:hypothetical protein MG295_00010 [Bacillus phage vB_BcgM]|nr:hypothetical protein MG295_00010 [Bacillus phage vB_BcgM]
MTRHTRNRQMKELCKDRSLHGMYFKGSNTDIEGNIRVYKEFGELDPTFNWMRIETYPNVFYNYMTYIKSGFKIIRIVKGRR